MNYFPILVDLTGKRCVVVGGGPIGERRAMAVLEQGAVVRVVAPSVSERLAELAESGRISWMNALYHADHLDGAFMVIAATDVAEINLTVARDAQARNILVASAGAAEDGNFVSPAVVRRGNLLLTVSTSGASPTLASVLREDIEREYGPEWAGITEVMGNLRDELKARHAAEQSRKTAVRAVLASTAVWEAVRRGDLAEAEALARQCI
jgi:precorrin-2 dehydrogenase/sirohydrochlorin ferrochelatase